jgi:hypothetical protein
MEKRRNITIVVCVIIGLLALIILLLSMGTKKGRQETVQAPVKLEQKESHSVPPESLQQIPETTSSLQSWLSSNKGSDSMNNPASALARSRTGKRSDAAGHPRLLQQPSTVSASDTTALSDSTMRQGETAHTSSAADKNTTGAMCANDTAAPWVYPDPSGGLHRKSISVKFVSSKPCTIEWKADSAADWIIYKGASIPVTRSTMLYFRAHDSCGNAMAERTELYELRPEETARFCPDGMEYVSVGATKFCIDRYEWPGKKGVVPLSYISIYSAMDSCIAAGKHLCTADEWTIACTGPYGWKYPYGNDYEPRACVSHDTCSRPSGSKPECRGYFDVYDMAGNLAEWTNTRSNKNPQFYNVNGGFWESGPHTGCFDAHYSYFPQNRHNPVGFRCCKEAEP